MSFLGGVFSSVSKAMDFLSGAVDIIVVQQPDKTFKCTPFHVKFGTLKILSSAERTVRIMVNGKLTDIYMKTEESGVAYFEPVTNNTISSTSNPNDVSGDSSLERSPFSKSPLSPSKEDFTFEDQQFSLDMDTLDNVKQTTPTGTRKIADAVSSAGSQAESLASIIVPNTLSVDRGATMDFSTPSTNVGVPNGSKSLSQQQLTTDTTSATDIAIKPLIIDNQQEKPNISVVQQSPSTVDPAVEDISNLKDIRIRVLIPPSPNGTPIGEGSKWFSWLSFFKKQNPANRNSTNAIADEESPAVKVVPDLQLPNTLNIIIQPSKQSGVTIALSDPLMQHALVQSGGGSLSSIPTTSKSSASDFAPASGGGVVGGVHDEDIRNAFKNSQSSLSLSGSAQDLQHLHSDFTEENEFIEEQFMEEIQRYHNNPIPKLESVKSLLSEKNLPEQVSEDIRNHNDKEVENVARNSALTTGNPLQVSTPGNPSQERQSVRSAGSGSDNEVTSASNKSDSSSGAVTFNQVKSTHGTPHNGSPRTSPPPPMKELVASNEQYRQQQQQQQPQITVPQSIKVSQKVDIRSSESLSKLTPSLPLSMSPPSGTTAVEDTDVLSSPSKNLEMNNVKIKQIEHEEVEEQASSAYPKASSWRLNWLWVDTKSPAGVHHKKSKETMQHKYYTGETSAYMIARSVRPTSNQLRSMMLRLGKNEIKFYVNSRFQGTQEIVANIWLWPYDAKIVISDVDGTITRSDVLGHFLPMFGKDWSHNGIASLYCSIAENGYRIVYLTSRSLLQAEQTRAYIRGVRQGDKSLPDGPIVTSPEKIFEVLTREVITKNPEEFKIAALRDIRSLFSKDVNPFYAGFGNKENDLLSYKTVGVHPSRIFIVDTSSKIRVDSIVTHKSYSDVDDLVHMIFPRLNENDHDPVDKQFSSFLFWKIPVESVEEVSRRVLPTSPANKPFKK